MFWKQHVVQQDRKEIGRDRKRACQGEREHPLRAAGEGSSWLFILPDSMIALVFSGLWPSHL